MVLPLLSTGLKIFQAARRKASSGSDAATKITSRQTTVSGKSVAKPKSVAIIKAQSDKISAAKFLQSTTDPSKDKIKSKGGIFAAFASIVNTINKFLSNILSILIGDNKLTKKQSDEERKKLALVGKRQRESNLEEDKGEGGETSTAKSKSKSSFFDRIIKFVTSIVIGSLVLALYRKFTDVIEFFKDTYETIKGFFEKLSEFISPLWNIFKWITSKFLNLFEKVEPNDDQKYADKIEKELKGQDKMLKDIEDEAGTTAGEVEGTDKELEKAEAEAKDDKGAVDDYRSDIASGNIMPSMFTPIEDRSFAKEMIKEHEGLSLEKYLDSKGLPTIGYGHLIDESSPDLMKMPVGGKISQERADELFEVDFVEHLDAARKIPGFNKASKRQQAALIDLTFNMGPNWYKGFPSFTKAFAAGDYDEAARQLQFADPDNRPGVPSGYVQDVGRRSDPILKLIKDKKLNDDSHLKSIENLLSEQSSVNSKLADSIALLSQDDEEFDDSPIIVPIPKPKTVVGGSGGGQMIVMGGDDVNSIVEMINLNNVAKV